MNEAFEDVVAPTVVDYPIQMYLGEIFENVS